MGNSNLCLAKEKIDEANLNLEDKLHNENVSQEELDFNQQKSRYQMLYDKRKPINSIPSNNISMELYDDKIYLPQSPEAKQKRNKQKANQNDDYIIDLDIEIYDGIDDMTYVNTKDRSQNKTTEYITPMPIKPINKTDIRNDKPIRNETANEMNKTSSTNNYNRDINDKLHLSSLLNKTQRSSVKSNDTQQKKYSFAIENINKETIALYQINIKESITLNNGKPFLINTFFSKKTLCGNQASDIIFQSDINKVTPKTLKLINNYCLATKDCFYIYKSKESFIFQLNPQNIIKLNSDTKISIVALSKKPNHSQINLSYKYFLLSSVRYIFVFACSNNNLFTKWVALLQHLINQSINTNN